ncbi:MAG: ABC transporter ATP-binding protein, partial [Oscillospiraceae bacterium]|nr:ABC transporter ATP-binding protein [Oscillospiraceae bacterium]
VGESGSGKSTLSKAILGMIKDVDGEINSRCTGTQMVFQDPIGSLNPARKVGWIIDESLRLKGGLSKAQRKEAAVQILDKVGLAPKYLERYPRELSGGQCQRVAIALCLLREPKLIIADEPVSALDVTIQAQILSLLLNLRKDLGLSYLFISHDMDVIWQICDRVMVMKNGRIVEQGTRDEVFDNPKDSYTKQLLEATSADFNPDI